VTVEQIEADIAGVGVVRVDAMPGAPRDEAAPMTGVFADRADAGLLHLAAIASPLRDGNAGQIDHGWQHTFLVEIGAVLMKQANATE
jgi:hypothetical protein